MPIRLLRPFGLAALLATVALPVPAQDAGPGDLAGAYLAARAADKAGDYTAVVEFGTRALEDDPDNTGLLEGLVMAHLGLGEIEAAIPPARHLSEIDGGNQIAGLVLLADAIRAEDWGAVDAFLEGGVTVGGLMDEMVRAWSAVGAGQMNEAIERFDALIEDGPAGQPALLQKALALALVGDYEGAAEILGGSEMVMRLNRGGVLAYIQVLSQLERNPDAAALLEEAYPETDDPELITLHDELVAGKPIPFTAVTSPRESIAQLFFEVGDSLRGETDPGLVLLYARIAGHPAARDRGIDHRSQAFLGHVVDHVEDAEPPTLRELVVDEVDRPPRVRHSDGQQRRPRPGRLLPTASLANGQPLLAVEPLGLLPVHHQPLPSQQHMQPPIAEPASLAGQRPHALAQPGIVGATAAVADRRPVRPDQGTRPPLAHLVGVHEDRDGFAPGGGRHHFRLRRSFNAAWSSRASANRRLSLAFSSSSAFSRFASETSMPPNFAFQA